MELWNNIWTNLTIPNEELIKICLIPMSFIEIALSFLLIVNIFNINYSKKQKILYIVILSGVCSITNFFISWPYNTIIYYISTFITIYLLFKMSILKTLVATAFPSIIFNLLGDLLLKPYILLLKISYEQSKTIFIYRIPFVSMLYLIVYITLLMVKNKKITINIFDSLDKKTKFFIITSFLLGILSLFFQGIIINNYSDILPIQFTIINFIFLFSYFSLSFYSLIKVMTLYTTKLKLESSEAYNKTLHILHDNVRGFKHDFDNIITTIGGYIRTNDIDGLKNYYSQLESDCIKVNNLYLLNPDVINNPGIYNLLTSKYNVAVENGIKVNLSFLLDLDNLNMKIYEFARILGILLDNAIEAASENDEKILNISFRTDSKNNRNIILIENTYKDKNINIDEIFKKGISGKENHTGLGLWEIRQILSKNNNVNLHTFKNDKLFSQQLEIYY